MKGGLGDERKDGEHRPSQHARLLQAAARTPCRTTPVLNEAIQVVDRAEPSQLDIDVADALVVEEALAGEAELFITGDAALLRIAAAGTVKYFHRGSGKRCELECCQPAVGSMSLVS